MSMLDLALPGVPVALPSCRSCLALSGRRSSGAFTEPENQTDDALTTHWSKHPDHLVAVRCDGLFIIDCDDEQAG